MRIIERKKIEEKPKIYGTIAVSNRHVHFTRETYEKLFDEAISIKRPVGQIGEFASMQTVTLEGPKGSIEHVRVMGPFRNYNQVEVSRSDALVLGIEPPVRTSGDLEESADITVIGPKGKVLLESSCIQAERHIHMNENKAQDLGLKDEDLVNIVIDNDKGGTMEAFVKVKPNGFYEIHIDKDDANCFMLKTGDEVEIRK